MNKLIDKIICKNIIKILTRYQKTLEHNELIFKNYIEQTIYFEIKYIVRLINERDDYNE